MFRFAFRPYRIDSAPKWADAPEHVDAIDALKRYIELESLWIYDTDNYLTLEEHLAVKAPDGSYSWYRIDHEVFQDYYDDLDEDVWFWENKFRWTTITEEEARVPRDRDWLRV